MLDVVQLLSRCGVKATPQRIVVTQHILNSRTHPSADDVWEQVRRTCPTLSRATVYNTLNLLVEKGLIRMQNLTEGAAAFEPRAAPHHHFIDEQTGRIYDIPWDALKVTGEEDLQGFEVREYQVTLRGRKRRT